MDRKERYYMSSVRLGPKGQIVIPKEARDMFGLQPGDTLVLLADKKKGLALQTCFSAKTIKFFQASKKLFCKIAKKGC